MYVLKRELKLNTELKELEQYTEKISVRINLREKKKKKKESVKRRRGEYFSLSESLRGFVILVVCMVHAKSILTFELFYLTLTSRGCPFLQLLIII